MGTGSHDMKKLSLFGFFALTASMVLTVYGYPVLVLTCSLVCC